jgi:3-deoxy-manno-octulosonate cytidylyltransferase (CMP-KDO synthetase)
MNTIAIIPARMGSSRFPGKPLAPLHGMPMLGHVYFRAAMSPRLDAVYIATCDEAIKRYALEIGAPCIMTSPSHARASDRTAEAADIIEARGGARPDVVVMIQGDEPMLHPGMIDEALAPLHADASVHVVNLMAPLQGDAADPNEIKVVVDRNGDALYFSRQPIPWQGRTCGAPVFKQVCVIPFRRDCLTAFAALEPTPLESAESIDMLRALEHGYRVRMALTAHTTYSVDTPLDLAKVAALMKHDPLVERYGEANCVEPC